MNSNSETIVKALNMFQSWTKVVETHENYQPFSFMNSAPSVKGSLSFPVFQFWKQLNIHEVFCKIVWGTEGVTVDA